MGRCASQVQKKKTLYNLIFMAHLNSKSASHGLPKAATPAPVNLPKLDIIVSMLAIHHFKNKTPLYETIYKIVSANRGVFILSDLVVDPRKNPEVYQFRRNHMVNEGMNEKEIDEWFQIFNEEDRPSTIQENLECFQVFVFSQRLCSKISVTRPLSTNENQTERR